MGSGRMPADPAGPGHFRDPVQPDREPQRPFGPDDDRYWAGVLGSPAARLGIPRPGQAIDSTSISHVLHASSWESLKSTALAMLGATSFDLGVAYGVGEGAWGVIEGLLDFLQMIVLNGLYQKVQRGSTSWNPLVRAEYRGVDYLLHSHLETAHREFRQLMDELRLVVTHPVEFFGNVWTAEVKEYSQRWRRYEWLMEHRSISNEFESGRIVGQTLLEVVLLLTVVWDGVGLAAKGVKALGELPELARLTAGVAKENLQKVPKLARLASGATREKAEGLLKALREKLGTGGGETVDGPAEPAKEAREQKQPPRLSQRPSYVDGQSDGGPGQWGPPSTPRNQLGAAYQQQVTGAPPGTEYKVPLATRKSGFVDFDGYDPERNVLVDAKDFNDWPPQEPEFLRQKAIDQLTQEAQDQLAAANGTPVEWHVPTDVKAQEIQDILDDAGNQAIKVVATPKP